MQSQWEESFGCKVKMDGMNTEEVLQSNRGNWGRCEVGTASLDRWMRLKLFYLFIKKIARLSPCRPHFEAGQACVSVCYLCLYWMKCSAVYGYSSVKRRYLCRVEIQGVHDHGDLQKQLELLRSLSPTNEPGAPAWYTSPVVFGSGTDAMQAHKSALHAVLHQCLQRAREHKWTSCDFFFKLYSFKGIVHPKKMNIVYST